MGIRGAVRFSGSTRSSTATTAVAAWNLVSAAIRTISSQSVSVSIPPRVSVASRFWTAWRWTVETPLSTPQTPPFLPKSMRSFELGRLKHFYQDLDFLTTAVEISEQLTFRFLRNQGLDLHT